MEILTYVYTGVRNAVSPIIIARFFEISFGVKYPFSELATIQLYMSLRSFERC
jgi:hypothetical protein